MRPMHCMPAGGGYPAASLACQPPARCGLSAIARRTAAGILRIARTHARALLALGLSPVATRARQSPPGLSDPQRPITARDLAAARARATVAIASTPTLANDATFSLPRMSATLLLDAVLLGSPVVGCGLPATSAPAAWWHQCIRAISATGQQCPIRRCIAHSGNIAH
ncbi:hypothetical protein XAC1361 [Xanthomonas citri pv. citri str. 306]|uniref:Uncharacterized protein n=2 Tax=Xanthomonas citri pv. citri TaxID=611301 RepID=A0AAI8ESC3_XANAC|nr:hypothetical protein XAC1361 [Xanthomonas citri pv. citri str. 306]CEE20636.1 conserved hypothetical protein [Xanthomonas citri pv. citri]CEE22028.1 conserved hypothetical protein [Xanthomonas citri pv. citri]CEE36698.1 conserved hypothetical protein [Xanthomonas citri pv. citri]CEE63467.1 conserved hypothetical protein [Xanthomonas citri pv. citri]